VHATGSKDAREFSEGLSDSSESITANREIFEKLSSSVPVGESNLLLGRPANREVSYGGRTNRRDSENAREPVDSLREREANVETPKSHYKRDSDREILSLYVIYVYTKGIIPDREILRDYSKDYPCQAATYIL
jgi:hypothetical protein